MRPCRKFDTRERILILTGMVAVIAIICGTVMTFFSTVRYTWTDFVIEFPLFPANCYQEAREKGQKKVSEAKSLILQKVVETIGNRGRKIQYLGKWKGPISVEFPHLP